MSEKKDQTNEVSNACKTAEWVTMAVSALIVLAVAGYLIYETFQPQEDQIPIAVEVKAERQAMEDGQMLATIAVANESERAVRGLMVEFDWREGDSRTQPRWVLLDYLAGGAQQEVHVFVPRESVDVQARARAYELE